MMETKMNKYSSSGESFLSKATQLSNEITNFSVIQKYQRAQKELNSDSGAMELIRKLSTARKELNQKQYLGTFTQDSLNEYSKIQNEVEKNKTINEYTQAQQEAMQFLKNVNLEISQLIGIDFSSLMKRSNTC